MFIVAITRWGPGFAAQLPELAKILDLFPYDLRMRLSGPLPVVVARMPEREAASSLMAKLREWGHGAVGCSASTVPGADAMHQPREFEFDGEVLRTQGVGRERAELRAGEVYALFHAMVLADHQTTEQKTVKKLSVSQTLLAGGVPMTAKKSSTVRATESESEERIYLIRHGWADPMVFCQHHLRYTGLGEAMGHSSHESFAALCARLRSFCPGAYYDDRLRTSRRKSSTSTSGGEAGSKSRTVTTSNASGVDLAVHLLLVAHARGQL
ncbi:hypothetical protein ENSA5_11150 [Enhygromyxa salina]|uniref:Uncharacterized protein n=1 Tax=Enhygromyxa salina TaxID=215803 RepID=A0A2S9YG37_9BACT|nr:hypothetical protein [Enhygromyxa salina]PRQ04067.1 hypothetical protein ENSA5_11150 [Enhygromyxa salina]